VLIIPGLPSFSGNSFTQTVEFINIRARQFEPSLAASKLARTQYFELVFKYLLNKRLSQDHRYFEKAIRHKNALKNPSHVSKTMPQTVYVLIYIMKQQTGKNI